MAKCVLHQLGQASTSQIEKEADHILDASILRLLFEEIAFRKNPQEYPAISSGAVKVLLDVSMGVSLWKP